jgi:hypothetical protein
MRWLARFLAGKKAPLRGAPASPRQKTYSAQSGYVYQYFYLGYRPVRGAVEFVFDVSSDRKTSFPVTVLVEDAAVEQWSRRNARDLSGTERYAVAKVALFQAFDERPEPSAMRAPVRVRAADLNAIIEKLGLL